MRWVDRKIDELIRYYRSRVREWGFWTNEGPGHTAKWIPFSEYVDNPDPLSPGYGQRKTR